MAITTKDGKTKWKYFHIFDGPHIIKTKEEANEANQLPLHQLKNLTCIFSDPYLVFVDNYTNTAYVCENGIPIRIFRPFNETIFFVKAQPVKNGWVCFIGEDFENNIKVVRIKFFPMGDIKDDN